MVEKVQDVQAFLAVARFPGRGAAVGLLDAFMGLPPVLVGLVLYLVLSRSGPLGPLGLLVVMMEIDPAHEDDFNRWYDEEHLPERTSCPGFLSGRRFVSVEGNPKYLAIYELEGPEALQTPEYLRYAHSPIVGDNVSEPVGSERTKRVLGSVQHVVRNVYVEIDPDDYPDSGIAESHLAT